MTRFLLILSFSFIFTFAHSQEATTTTEEAIRTEFTSYIDALANKDLETALSYMNPAIFDIVSADQLLLVMKQLYDNPAFDFKMKDPKILSVGESELFDTTHYATLSYSNILLMKFIFPDMDDATKSATMDGILVSLKQTFGKDAVKLNEKTEYFEIYSEKDVCAASADGETNWKFLVLEKQQEEMLKQILPDAYLNKVTFK